MSVLIWLVPIALLMGAAGLAAFFWSLKSGQYEDLSGAAERILLDDEDHPIADPASAEHRPKRRSPVPFPPATRKDDRHR